MTGEALAAAVGIIGILIGVIILLDRAIGRRNPPPPRKHHPPYDIEDDDF